MHKSRVALLLGGAFVVAAGTPSFAATLTGTVTSAKEGAMEGVLVTAKKDGSTMSVTVVSDDKGRYSFPEGRLTPGHYNLKIRAIGYILNGPRAVDVGNAATTADIKLDTTTNLAPQMTNVEWLNSLPGTDAEKRDLIACATCHTLMRPLFSSYTKDQVKSDLIPRMADMASQAMPGLVQKRLVRRDQAGTFGGLDRLANARAADGLSVLGNCRDRKN